MLCTQHSKKHLIIVFMPIKACKTELSDKAKKKDIFGVTNLALLCPKVFRAETFGD